jgi:hypothetical protein
MVSCLTSRGVGGGGVSSSMFSNVVQPVNAVPTNTKPMAFNR